MERSEYGPYPEHDIVIEDDGINFSILDVFPSAQCKRITLDAMLSKEGYRHYENRHDLLVAARGGCRICLWIHGILLRSGIVESYPFPPIMRYDSKKCRMSFSASKFLSLFMDEGVLILHSTRCSRQSLEGDPAASQIHTRRVTK